MSSPREPRHAPGNRFGSWVLVRYLATGGNGEVWEARSDDGRSGAIKILFRFGGDGYPRFRREAEIHLSLDASVWQVLPLLDAHLPVTPSRKDAPWLVTALAQPVTAVLADKPTAAKVEAVGQVAATLADLEDQIGLHHRDVKPPNIFEHNSRFVIGDFGLAARPSDPELTEPGQVIGPWHYLPSEVFVSSDDEVDWGRVDVACLAKSLWQLVAQTDRVPRGALIPRGHYRLTKYSGENFIGELDTALALATDDDPAARLTMRQFAERLADWLDAADVRDQTVELDQRLRANRDVVLQWIVQHVRTTLTNGLVFDVADPSAPSGIEALTDGEASEAFAELVEIFMITAEPAHTLGRSDPLRWTQIYPTVYGIDAAEGEDAVLLEAVPVLREFLQARQILELRPNEKYEIGELSLSAATLHFYLRYLSERGLIDFNDRYRESGGSILLMEVRTTVHGREFLISQK
jgi:hypothetical protein